MRELSHVVPDRAMRHLDDGATRVLVCCRVSRLVLSHAAIVDYSASGAPGVDAVARELNTRPRQTLNWMKPSEVFNRGVAMTG